MFRHTHKTRDSWTIPRDLFKKHKAVLYNHILAWRMGEAAARRKLRHIACEACRDECVCYYHYKPEKKRFVLMAT